MTKENAKQGVLSARQKRAIPRLVACGTQKAGLKDAGLCRNTLHRWMKDPAFQEELDRQRNAVLAEALNVLKANTRRAAETLVGLLDSSNEFLKRLTANDVLAHVQKARELETIEDRIAVIEQALNLGGGE